MKTVLDDSSGFTLIELIVVIAIIGVLSSIAVMASRDMYASYQLRGAARSVYSDMQYARLTAIKRGKETLIDWGKDASGNIYYNPKYKADGSKLEKLDAKIYLTGQNASYKNIKVCHPTDPSSDLIDVQFNPNGTSTVGSMTGIKLSMGGRAYRVYVSSAGTGNIRVLNKSALLDEGKNADECP